MTAAVGGRDDDDDVALRDLPERYDASPPPSATDRLIRFAYGLGVPARLLTRPFGRTPRLRLTATVENPLPGDPVAGSALRAGYFLIRGARRACDAADFASGAALQLPVADVLHGFTWLADLAASGPREQVAPIAERLLQDWLGANPRPPRRPARSGAWTIAHAGERLLGWLVHAPLILSSGDKAARARSLAAMVAHARWLDARARRAPDLAAAAQAWAALVAAGLLLPDGRPRELRALAALSRALGEQVGDDGGVLSRSPVAQAEAIALLVRLCACYRACRRAPPAQITAMLARMVPPLAGLIHGDGGLGSWQGGHATGRERIDQLLVASGGARRALVPDAGPHGGQWGYQRIAARQSVLQVDGAPPPLARHARHGCAGTLAFEFSYGDQRLVVNCGGAAAAGGLVPASLGKGLRATAAHSTLTLDDANSSAILSDGRVGKGVATVDVERTVVAGSASSLGAVRIEASHDGYARRYGLIHRRVLELCDDGRELSGEDRLEPAARRGRRRKVGFAIRFHLGPYVDCVVHHDRASVGASTAQLALPDGSVWRFEAAAGSLDVDDSVWVDGAGAPVAIRQLVLHDVVGRTGAAYAWRFSRVA